MDERKARTNRSKHGVAFEAAMTVFLDPLALSRPDYDSIDEERWITIGEARSGELLLVIHSFVDLEPDRALIRIISARRPTRREADQYREKDTP